MTRFVNSWEKKVHCITSSHYIPDYLLKKLPKICVLDENIYFISWRLHRNKTCREICILASCVAENIIISYLTTKLIVFLKKKKLGNINCYWWSLPQSTVCEMSNGGSRLPWKQSVKIYSSAICIFAFS